MKPIMNFLNVSTNCDIDPNNLSTGIYQYWGVYFDTSPVQIPHLIIAFCGQSLMFQLGAGYNGDLRFRMRGASYNEWTSWRKVTYE